MAPLPDETFRAWMRKIGVPEGPYYVSMDDATDCPPHANSGLSMVDTGRTGDWPIARLCERPAARLIAKLPQMLWLLWEAEAHMSGSIEYDNYRVASRLKLIREITALLSSIESGHE